MNYKILKTFTRIPGPQSRIVHVDKLKLIHTEPGLEESHIPVEENSPVFPSEIDGVHPRRIIRKPKYLANDYVCNLFSASPDLSVSSLFTPAIYFPQTMERSFVCRAWGEKCQSLRNCLEGSSE